MYIIKNAIKNLYRNKGRNILLLIVMIAVIASTTVAVLINQTSDAVIKDYKSRFGATAQINQDLENTSDWEFDENGQFKTISVEQYMNFTNSKYLKNFELTISTNLGLDGAKGVDEENMQSFEGGNTVQLKYPSAINLVSNANASSMKDFKNGKRKIVEGSMYKNKNECLVSQEFADKNNLKVGDSFTAVEELGEQITKLKLKVSGIYADSTEKYPGGIQIITQNRRNEILISLDTLKSLNLNTQFMIPTASYELISPDVLKDFQKELESKGLPKGYKVDVDETSYNKIIQPVLGLCKITNAFMWIVLIVGSAIILLVSTMAIRERKYEIAVLRSMGLKKMKVVTMLLAEIVIITSVGLAAGLGIGISTSQPVANTLLSQQVQIAEESQQQNMNGLMFYEEPSTSEEPLSEISVKLDSATIAKIYFIALVLAILSTSMSAVYITKFEPLKLLSERS